MSAFRELEENFEAMRAEIAALRREVADLRGRLEAVENRSELQAIASAPFHAPDPAEILGGLDETAADLASLDQFEEDATRRSAARLDETPRGGSGDRDEAGSPADDAPRVETPTDEELMGLLESFTSEEVPRSAPPAAPSAAPVSEPPPRPSRVAADSPDPGKFDFDLEKLDKELLK